jgi:hypothetical protein
VIIVAIELASSSAAVIGLSFGGGDRRGDRGKKSECASWFHSQ